MRMRKSLIALAAILAVSGAVAAEPTPRILLVGDSWAWFMYSYRSFPQALAERGMDDVGVMGAFTTVPGSTVKQWTDPAWLAQITRALEENPTLSIVHLSLGGNDFLRGWEPEMTDAARDQLFQGVVDDIEVVAKHCLSIRPDIHVAISGYDYINAKRGNGTLQQLNRAGQLLAGMKRAMAERLERTEYIQNYGVMQYYFGAEGLPARSVPMPGEAPDFDPWPGGNAEFGNAPEAMTDNIHLSPLGYRYLAGNCIDALYAEWLGAGEAPLAAASEQESAR